MRRLSAAVALLAWSLLVSCSSGTADKKSQTGQSAEKSQVKAESERKAAPAWTLKDSDGRTVNLSDYKGKVVLLNFWATWCGPCKIEIPWFIEFEQKFKDRGFAVLGVAMDEEGWEIVKPYLQQNKVNYRVVMGNDVVAQQYGGVESLPTTFILDGDGRIARTHVGLVSKSEYESDIVHLLDRRASAGSHDAAEYTASR